MVQKAEIREALDRYFSSVGRDQFIKDLKKAGFSICEVDGLKAEEREAGRLPSAETSGPRKGSMKVWQKDVTGILEPDDPEEQDLAERFNENFTELLRIVPKGHGRKVLFDLLHDVRDLYNLGASRNWKDGFAYRAEHYPETPIRVRR